MPRITRPHFTGHVGPVRFTDGVAETDDPDVLAYCSEHPAFTVETPALEHRDHDDEDPEVAVQLDAIDTRED